MSVSIYVVAQKKLSTSDFEKVELYNRLYENSYDIPNQLKEDIESFLGKDIFDDGSISIPTVTDIVEIPIRGEGDVMYDDGLVVQVNNLPSNTVSIRIYAMA